MATSEFFYVVIYPNGVIRYDEKGVLFESSAPIMFRSHSLETLSELKNLILANVSEAGRKQIGKVGYRFRSILPGGRGFVNHLFWVTGDDYVRVMFEVHRKLMPLQVMELYAEVRDIEVSSEFFFVVVYANAVIRNGENGEIFESNAPIKFRSHRLGSLNELKNLIWTNVSGAGFKEIGNVGYRFLSLLQDGRFVNRVVWITGDDRVRWMFDIHRKLMPLRVMELYAEVRDIGGYSAPSSFVLRDPPLSATPNRSVGPGDVAGEGSSKRGKKMQKRKI
ncbi:hypothetical protein PIB30_049348 [Stylosanthes scabra]|uniref:Uncharacterized protein n=1 Tax=Stylosanthes scabra TaxID=79078 RepID=A0ABU6RI51_9FABA|nr:hypothetical protein [Stylosanthes scabra]